MSARLRPIATSRAALWAAIAVAGLIIATATLAVRAADRLVLWRIVHEKCVVDQRANGAPAPCALVDISGGEDNGVAILKDINGIAQHLAIPTRRIAGVESPDILDASLPNYWRAAWAARSYLNARLPHELPRDAIGMAINAASRRSQDQLHIHIDCVAPDVRDALGAYNGRLSADWHVLPFLLKGRRYWARRLDSVDLSDAAPFRLLAEGVEGAKNDMAQETLVAIGATFAPASPGFILLADRADPGAGGHGEDLLDARCAIAGAA
ncbi:CDP-diacylglycerol diphosphatase [Methylocapsa sp. S129]|uniref:CDP-diacylglycerol diphosphatase n=1 Tax=Methylocapsa sp. S129 TaxID=1641869 RepID=UPI00131E2150|nr:CDP-diacylglycerol diphosphatase [Methylocapsa sp. S129]